MCDSLKGWLYRKQSTLESFIPERWSQFSGQCRLAWEMIVHSLSKSAHVIEAALQPHNTNLYVVVLVEWLILVLWWQGFELSNSSYIHTSLYLAWCFSLIRSWLDPVRKLLLQLGHFSILSALVRAGGLNCSVGILGGLWKNFKEKKLHNVFLKVGNEKTGYSFVGGGMFLLLLTLLTFFQGIIFFKINEWRYIYIYTIYGYIMEIYIWNIY